MSPNPEEFVDKSRGIRIQKAMADAGVASRRDCEQLVTEGRVTVNGKPVTELPAWVDPDFDRIAVDGVGVNKKKKGSSTPRRIYVMLNKTRGTISTTDDPDDRRSVTDMVDIPGEPRLFPVGRLDAESTGLILLTNDGELAQQLTHPKFEITKQYQVMVSGRMTQQDVDVLKRGLFLAPRKDKAVTRRAQMDDIKLIGHSRGKAGGERTRLSVTLSEGQNREIRRLLARLGFKVRRLQRVAIGPLRLKGVAPGEWRMLTASETATLKRLAERQAREVE